MAREGTCQFAGAFIKGQAGRETNGRCFVRRPSHASVWVATFSGDVGERRRLIRTVRSARCECGDGASESHSSSDLLLVAVSRLNECANSHEVLSVFHAQLNVPLLYDALRRCLCGATFFVLVA